MTGALETFDMDVAVLGLGGAGATLVLAIERAARARGVPPPSIAVVDPVRRSADDRTWCWWSASHPDPLEPLLTRAWSELELSDAAGTRHTYSLDGMRYLMLRSGALFAAAGAALDRMTASSRVVRVDAPAGVVGDGPAAAVVEAGGRRLRASWVFDSRPAAPRRPGGTALVQHFRGWTVRFEKPLLDPGVVTLMDFGVPQPERGVTFGYVLPVSEHEGLVEYTGFGPAALRGAEYDGHLRDYLRRRWDVEPGPDAEVVAVEDGTIPMTDAPFPRRTGHRVFRLGTAGGATRPATGYTFAAMTRQAEAVAESLLAGRTPLPPAPYPARHRWMDAVLLRALDRTGPGHLDPPALFTGLFAANPVETVLRFLDGHSSLREEVALMRSTPLGPMLRATAEDAVSRLLRRLPRA